MGIITVIYLMLFKKLNNSLQSTKKLLEISTYIEIFTHGIKIGRMDFTAHGKLQCGNDLAYVYDTIQKNSTLLRHIGIFFVPVAV